MKTSLAHLNFETCQQKDPRQQNSAGAAHQKIPTPRKQWCPPPHSRSNMNKKNTLNMGLQQCFNLKSNTEMAYCIRYLEVRNAQICLFLHQYKITTSYVRPGKKNPWFTCGEGQTQVHACPKYWNPWSFHFRSRMYHDVHEVICG